MANYDFMWFLNKIIIKCLFPNRTFPCEIYSFLITLLTKLLMRSLTIEGAYQMYSENERGSIKEGKYADFIIIDKDVLTCDVQELHNTQVLNTFFEGKCVYEKK